jgi:two-component system cell cycle sensor histidine kinase/response regulator CckA
LPPVDFRPLFEDNPNPIIVFDGVTRRLLAANDAACRHFGYARDELLGRDVSSLRPDQDTDRMREAYAASRASGLDDGPIRFPGVWRHLRKDGTVALVEIWRLRIEYEGHAAVMAIIQDVSARVHSEERYRLLFDATPVPIFVFDAETLSYLAVNEAALQKYGYSRDELLSMTVLDIRPTEDVPRLKRALSGLKDANLDAGTWRHRKSDGTTFDVEITTHAIEFAGRPARLVMASDVTERRRVEEQLRQSQRMEATGLLAGGVAHDFNNLLAVVLGSGELARRALREGRPVEPYLAEMDAAARRAADLTRKLLVFSRKQILEVRTLDLAEAVEDFLQLLRRVIGEDVELVARRSSQPLLVVADASQVEQVLLNLCTNARQAMPAGGRITLETRRARFDAQDLHGAPWAQVGDWAEVRVVDSGEGMDPATLARAFEPFFTTKPAGTGLGLAMVHGIVHQHHGFVHVESCSRDGVSGTTVHVYLPIAREAVEPAHERAPSLGLPLLGGRETVLVAEDEPPLRGLLAMTLSELGYEVLTASDGEEAARVFAERRAQVPRVSLAILDVVMPHLGGVQAFQRMRALDPALKVIFITGYAPEHAQVSDILGSGGHAVLHKPFALKELGHKVRETLDGRP